MKYNSFTSNAFIQNCPYGHELISWGESLSTPKIQWKFNIGRYLKDSNSYEAEFDAPTSDAPNHYFLKLSCKILQKNDPEFKVIEKIDTL